MAEDRTEARKRAVDHLERLFTLLVGLAIALAFGRASTHDEVANMRDWQELSRLAVFLVTVIPFAHGALRYLDAAYVTGESPARDTGFLCDGMLLLTEAAILTSMAAVLPNEGEFWFFYALLLTIDIIWVWTTVFHKEGKCSQADPPTADYKWWSLINGIAVLLVLLTAYTVFIKDESRWIVLAALGVLRTVGDIAVTKGFYFPGPRLQATE